MKPSVGTKVSYSSIYKRLNPSIKDGHEVDLLVSGKQFFPALEEAISSARSSVYLETYIFFDDEAGTRIAQCLADAARRGVRVHLIVDGFGTSKRQGKWAQLLHEAKIHIAVFRPEKNIFSLSLKRLRRLHRKLAIVDGHIAFVGGINILDDYNDPNYGALKEPRLDYAVRVLGPLVQQIHITMARLWRELVPASRRHHAHIDPATISPSRYNQELEIGSGVWSTVTPVGTVRAGILFRDNFRHRASIEQYYLKEIRKAKREILIACAYFLPGLEFRRALKEAAKRGVQVCLLLQGKPEYPLQYYASQAMYCDLLNAGIEIFEYRKSFLHAKVAVIDDWATVGSSNIDPFSLFLAREANIIVENINFSSQLRKDINEAIENGSEKIHSEQHPAASTWFAKIRNWTYYTLLRLAIAFIPSHDRY